MVALADVKDYLRIDHADDDTVLERHIAAASAHLAAMGVAIDATPLPADIEQAQYLLIQHFYDNHDGSVTHTVDRLVAPHREHGI